MSKNYPIIQRLGTAVPTAADIVTNTAGWSHLLGAGDLDVQGALDSIDNMSILDIQDTPSTFTSQAGKLLQVNTGETILQFTDTLADGTKAVTQSPGDNSTKVATTEYVDAAVTVEDTWNRTGTTLNPSTSTDAVEWDEFKYQDATTGGLSNLYVGSLAGNNCITDNNLAFGANAAENNTGTSVTAIGSLAAESNSGSNAIAIGDQAMENNSGQDCLGVGKRALESNSGNNCTAVGTGCLQANSGAFCNGHGQDILRTNSGSYNDGFGFQSMYSMSTGAQNVAMGQGTLRSTSTGSNNVAIGRLAGRLNVGGGNSVFLGHSAGYSNTGGGGVYLGYNAGYNETGANKLYIENSNSSSPLIYGEFDNNLVQINGDLHAEQVVNFTVYANSTPAAGDLWFEDNHLTFVPVADERVISYGNGTIVADTTVANTVTETLINTIDVSADEFHVGQLIKVHILGYYSTANASDTFDARIKIGGTTVSTLTSIPKNVTNGGFDIAFTATVRTIGASGTIRPHATALFNTDSVEVPGTSNVTIDTTTNNDVTLTIQWDSANVSNTVTVTQSYIEFIG